MHDQRNPCGSSPRNSSFSPAEHDARVQQVLLGLVLAEHPLQLTATEIVRELAADPEDFGERDAVERALRDLVTVGLLHRYGPFVLPTRVAAYLEWLELGDA